MEDRSLDDFLDAGSDGAEASADDADVDVNDADADPGDSDTDANDAAAAPADATDESADVAAEAVNDAAAAETGATDAPETPAEPDAVEPAASTYVRLPDGGACAACGETVERRWRGEQGLVCPDCKAW